MGGALYLPSSGWRRLGTRALHNASSQHAEVRLERLGRRPPDTSMKKVFLTESCPARLRPGGAPGSYTSNRRPSSPEEDDCTKHLGTEASNFVSPSFCLEESKREEAATRPRRRSTPKWQVKSAATQQGVAEPKAERPPISRQRGCRCGSIYAIVPGAVLASVLLCGQHPSVTEHGLVTSPQPVR